MFEVGQEVKARIDLVEDMSEIGGGWNVCARAGDRLFIRRKSPYIKGRYYVSHDGVLDSVFSADDHELESC